MKHTEVA